jgi:hypothetical protein
VPGSRLREGHAVACRERDCSRNAHSSCGPDAASTIGTKRPVRQPRCTGSRGHAFDATDTDQLATSSHTRLLTRRAATDAGSRRHAADANRVYASAGLDMPDAAYGLSGFSFWQLLLSGQQRQYRGWDGELSQAPSDALEGSVEIGVQRRVPVSPAETDAETPARVWRTLFLGAAFIILIGCLSAILLSVRAPHTTSVPPIDRVASISQCVEHFAPSLKAVESGASDMTGAFTLCYNITAAALLADEQFNRNENLAFQMSENVVLMWMVVIITVSGVLLAGLQLFASYRLASVGKGTLSDGGTLRLENGSVIVQSSVVGVIILAISFAFFTIFVRDVYAITQIPGATPPQIQSAQQNPMANMGHAIAPAPPAKTP